MSESLGRLNVSRETMERLKHYESLLLKWNPKINLVSKATLNDIWERHILDSAQVFQLGAETTTNWLDIGSGGGFPGMVLATLSKEQSPDRQIALVESDQRKCAFLRTVARETDCKVQVYAERIEKLPPQNANVLTARALADLTKLLEFADLHLAPKGTCLFQKGASWEKELQAAQDSWRFEYEAIKSETSDEAVILRINGIEHV